jgi:hypothetical protein
MVFFMPAFCGQLRLHPKCGQDYASPAVRQIRLNVVGQPGQTRETIRQTGSRFASASLPERNGPDVASTEKSISTFTLKL